LTETLSPSIQFNQIILQGVEEILGIEALRKVFLMDRSLLNPADRGCPPVPLHELAVYLQSIYGEQGGKGIILRSGRSSFKYVLSHFEERLHLNTMGFRLLPTIRRLDVALQALADLLSATLGSCVRLNKEKESWLWVVENCQECWRHTADATMCTFTIGLLQELLAWAGGGKFYPVTEIECAACGGSSCTFRIEKLSLD
jgi:hypothetical protein